jgi:hypothetical protein
MVLNPAARVETAARAVVVGQERLPETQAAQAQQIKATQAAED